MIYYIEGIFDELGYNWKRIIFLITKMRFIIIPRLGNVIDLVSCQTFNNSLCVLFLILTCLCFLPRLLLIVIRSSLLIINNGPALIDVFFLTFNSVTIELFSSKSGSNGCDHWLLLCCWSCCWRLTAAGHLITRPSHRADAQSHVTCSHHRPPVNQAGQPADFMLNTSRKYLNIW